MGIVNCAGCGKLCLETPNRLCANCLKGLLDNEIKVADYLRLHEHSSIDEVYEATKVEKDVIIKMIREGRIIEGKLAYPCENCNATISSGRMCRSCMDKALESLEPMAQKGQEEDRKTGGMFISRTFENKD
ncbi:MAG: flagellar protein [Negativicutes bacterium]|nr:flagellar protein [Negativicutes bacterium]